MVLSRQRLHKHIGVNIATRTCARLWNEPLPLVGSGADNHQEGPDILPKDSGYLRDAEGASAPCTGLRKSKYDQYHLIIQHFSIMPPKTERSGDGGKALLLEADVRIGIVFK